MNKLILIAIYACIYTIKTTNQNELNLSEIFKQFLFDNNNNNKVDYVSKLNEYQINTLKSRNAECLFHKYATIEESEINNEFTSLNETQLAVYLENRVNFTSFLNKSVSITHTNTHIYMHIFILIFNF